MTPDPSPQKKRKRVGSRKVSAGLLTTESTAHATAVLGLEEEAPPAGSMSVQRGSGMLPTPAKTPAKTREKESAKNIQSIARNLFCQPEEAVEAPSTPLKRRGKAYTGVSLESFRAEDDDEDIKIFTDANELAPERDASAANPFYGQIKEPKKRSPRKGKVMVQGQVQSLEDAEKRTDGMVYTL